MVRLAHQMVKEHEGVVYAYPDDDENSKEHDERYLRNAEHHTVEEIRDGEGKNDLQSYDEGQKDR